jgi:hypothetical protein
LGENSSATGREKSVLGGNNRGKGDVRLLVEDALLGFRSASDVPRNPLDHFPASRIVGFNTDEGFFARYGT